MSKKSRRQRTPNLPPEAFVTPQAASTRAPAASAAPTKPAPGADAPAKTVDWQREYGAVLGDLKRTGILAGILLVIMVVLSIIIP
jgi:hypothetical protein